MERYDLKVFQGETFRQELVFRDSAGAIIDLTGYEGFSQIRPDPDSDELICSMYCTVDGPAGKVIMEIVPLANRRIKPGCYAYDFALRDPYTNVRYYIGGKFTVLPAVTEVP